MSHAWADYWAPKAGGRRGGCLPDAGPLAGLLDGLWREFARSLPPKAQVLDLATGDGAVPRILVAERRDLRCTGVDSAPELPPSPPGVRLRAGVAMEALPFEDARFDAVTSQFGIEYGDIGRIALEAARVVHRGGRMRAALHHKDGAIVVHNVGRKAALRWAIEESGLLDRARTLARARSTIPLPTPPAFPAAIEEARRLFPAQSAAAEVTTAIVQALENGIGQPPSATLEVLSSLEARARAEIARIAQLERAALDENGVAALVEVMTAAGLACDQTRPLRERGGEGSPIAWVFDARRN